MPQGAGKLHGQIAPRRRASDPLHLPRTDVRRLHFQSAAQMADRHCEHLGEIGGRGSANPVAQERRLRKRDYNSGFRLLNMSTELEEKQAPPESAEEQIKIPETLPVLPLRDIVIFPFMIVPLFVSRERSIRAVDQALAENRMIMLTAQRDSDKEEPGQGDLYDVGTVAIIMRMLKLPDGRIRILVQGIARAKVNYMEDNQSYLQARIEELKENPPKENLELKVEDAQTVLEQLDVTPRLHRVNELLTKEIEVLTVQQEINMQAKGEIDRSQREFYLRQQLKAIQQELGEGNELAEDIAQYREKKIGRA